MRLRAGYQPTAYWVHPLLNALNAKPALGSKHADWPGHKLSDVAFSIETRLGGLLEIVRHVDENLNRLARELKQVSNLDAYVQGGYAWMFDDDEALRRLLTGVSCFLAESRACFENLAVFYREFVRHYFSESVSLSASYERIAQLTSAPKWADDLKSIRNEVVHDRAPWLEFEIGPGPLYEPIFIFNWRPGPLAPGDNVSMETIKTIRAGLAEAALKLRDYLVERVKSDH